MSQIIDIADHIDAVRARISAACQRAGRSPDEITAVAVSKTMPAEMVLHAMKAGIRDFGENRLEEALSKMQQVSGQVETPPRWHMIGHIQSRKAREVVRAGFTLVHSLDSLRLAQRYDRFAE